MNKRQFLKTTGMLGVSSIIPHGKSFTAENPDTPKVCTLIPSETAGPFPLDLSTNTFFFRQDVRENKTGAQLNLKLKIIGTQNCQPMQNVRVNIWHCDKDGLYSGYDQPGNSGQAGLTYLRGYQITDAFGNVEFITIFPGWYNGRVCHIHFQVYVSTSYAAVSQLTFDVPTKNAIYAAFPSLYTKGADPLSPSNDNIFSDGYSLQILTPTPNSTTGGYDGFLEINVQGSGTVGVGHQERENSKQFSVGQNYPNPYTTKTTIPFTLNLPSHVTLDLWDVLGRKVATVLQQSMSEGEHQIVINPQSLGLALGNYVYQIRVVNSNGTFVDNKMMTVWPEHK